MSENQSTGQPGQLKPRLKKITVVIGKWECLQFDWSSRSRLWGGHIVRLVLKYTNSPWPSCSWACILGACKPSISHYKALDTSIRRWPFQPCRLVVWLVGGSVGWTTQKLLNRFSKIWCKDGTFWQGSGQRGITFFNIVSYWYSLIYLA